MGVTRRWRNSKGITRGHNSMIPRLISRRRSYDSFIPWLIMDMRAENYLGVRKWHFRWSEGHTLYQTRIEKWVLQLKRGVSQLHTISSSGDIEFGLFDHFRSLLPPKSALPVVEKLIHHTYTIKLGSCDYFEVSVNLVRVVVSKILDWTFWSCFCLFGPKTVLPVVWRAYIISNTNRKVGTPVKTRGQPTSYDQPFRRYLIKAFWLFLVPISAEITTSGGRKVDSS